MCFWIVTYEEVIIDVYSCIQSTQESLLTENRGSLAVGIADVYNFTRSNHSDQLSIAKIDLFITRRKLKVHKGSLHVDQLKRKQLR